MEDVPVVFEDLRRHAAIYCEVSDRQENTKDINS